MFGVNAMFPNFVLDGVMDDAIVTIDSMKIPGWKIIYFYPKDFTFICPTEIISMDMLVEDASVIGISPDNEHCKLAWKKQNEDLANISHPLLADRGLALSSELGIVDHKENVCLRATFILNESNVIKHVSCNELDTGRNAQEILRTLKALQAGGLTGCEWNPGDDFVA